MPAPMPSNEPASAGPAAAGGVVCSTGSPVTTLEGGGPAFEVAWAGTLAWWRSVGLIPWRSRSGRDLAYLIARITFGLRACEDELAGSVGETEPLRDAGKIPATPTARGPSPP